VFTSHDEFSLSASLGSLSFFSHTTIAIMVVQTNKFTGNPMVPREAYIIFLLHLDILYAANSQQNNYCRIFCYCGYS